MSLQGSMSTPYFDGSASGYYYQGSGAMMHQPVRQQWIQLFLKPTFVSLPKDFFLVSDLTFTFLAFLLLFSHGMSFSSSIICTTHLCLMSPTYFLTRRPFTGSLSRTVFGRNFTARTRWSCRRSTLRNMDFQRNCTSTILCTHWIRHRRNRPRCLGINPAFTSACAVSMDERMPFEGSKGSG